MLYFRAPCCSVLSVTHMSNSCCMHRSVITESLIVKRIDVRMPSSGRGQLKCDGTCAETRFRLSAKRTNPFKSAVASVQSTTGSRDVRISGSNAGYTIFLSSVKSTGYPLHSPVSPSLPFPCVTVCHHISTGVYNFCAKFCGSMLYKKRGNGGNCITRS